MNTDIPFNTCRWLGRVLSLGSLGLLLLFMVGEGFNPLRMKPQEALLCLFFPLGVMAGMILGWWRALAGGVLGCACVVAFYMVHFAQRGRFPHGPWFVVIALPALIFLVAGLWQRHRQSLHA